MIIMKEYRPYWYCAQCGREFYELHDAIKHTCPRDPK